MRHPAEVEADTALRIAQAMAETIGRLEGYWPPSRRGSNAQKMLDDIKAKRATIEQCLRDAISALT